MIAALLQRCRPLQTRVRRVVGNIVFLDLPPPWISATVRRIEGWDPIVGSVVEIGGFDDDRLSDQNKRGFRALFITLNSTPSLLVGEGELPNLFPDLYPQPPTPR